MTPRAGKYDLDIHLDTYWDNDPDGGTSKHAVRDIVIPLIVEGTEPGRVPVVDRERLIPDVYAMLAATAGIGNTAITGDKLTEMPQLDGKTSTSVRLLPPPPPTPSPPTSASTTKRPPAPLCRRPCSPAASLPMRWSARPGRRFTRRSAPCTSRATR